MSISAHNSSKKPNYPFLLGCLTSIISAAAVAASLIVHASAKTLAVAATLTSTKTLLAAGLVTSAGFIGPIVGILVGIACLALLFRFAWSYYTPTPAVRVGPTLPIYDPYPNRWGGFWSRRYVPSPAVIVPPYAPYHTHMHGHGLNMRPHDDRGQHHTHRHGHY